MVARIVRLLRFHQFNRAMYQIEATATNQNQATAAILIMTNRSPFFGVEH
jgi:hypothetical protein